MPLKQVRSTLQAQAASVWVYANLSGDWSTGVCSSGWLGVGLDMLVLIDTTCEASVSLAGATPAVVGCRAMNM